MPTGVKMDLLSYDKDFLIELLIDLRSQLRSEMLCSDYEDDIHDALVMLGDVADR